MLLITRRKLLTQASAGCVLLAGAAFPLHRASATVAEAFRGDGATPPDPSYAGVPGGVQWSKDMAGNSWDIYRSRDDYLRDSPEWQVSTIIRDAFTGRMTIGDLKEGLERAFDMLTGPKPANNGKYRAMSDGGKLVEVWARRKCTKTGDVNYNVSFIVGTIWPREHVTWQEAASFAIREANRLNAWEANMVVNYIMQREPPGIAVRHFKDAEGRRWVEVANVRR